MLKVSPNFNLIFSVIPDESIDAPSSFLFFPTLLEDMEELLIFGTLSALPLYCPSYT